MVRVEFGTGQIASAFGCNININKDSLPSVDSHVLKKSEDIFNVSKPYLFDGLYKQIDDYINYFLNHLPPKIPIQLPDIQSAFNSAHLIRGNDIFTDFFYAPDAVNRLLELITQFMKEKVPHLLNKISNDKEWFFDWGCLWKGQARISNCSMQMISPDLYKQFVLDKDIDFLKSIGGGRIHYCGKTREVIDSFFDNDKMLVTGFDYDAKYHDLWDLCESVPENCVLMQKIYKGTKTERKLLSKEWPDKKNLVVVLEAETIEEGKKILSDYKNSLV